MAQPGVACPRPNHSFRGGSMRDQRMALRTVLAMILVACFPVIALSQVNIGSLSGVVSDPSGAGIPGAEVVLVNTATQEKHQTTTDTTGAYSILALPIGDYSLTVSRASFHTANRTGILLSAGANVRVDVSLELGHTTQQLTVRGAPPLLETRSGSLTESVSVNVLTDLPLLLSGSKRDPSIYVATIPGYQAGAGFYNAINGSISAYSELFVDGTPFLINDAVHGVTRNVFSAEAV